MKQRWQNNVGRGRTVILKKMPALPAFCGAIVKMQASGVASSSAAAAQGSPVPPFPDRQLQRAQSPPPLVAPLRKKARLGAAGGRDLTAEFHEEAAAKQAACEAKVALDALLSSALKLIVAVRNQLTAKARGDAQDAQDQSALADNQIAAMDAVESVLLAVPSLGAAGSLQPDVQAALGTLRKALAQSSPAELAMRIVSDCGAMGGGRRSSRRSRPKSGKQDRSRRRVGSRKRRKARKSKRNRSGKPRRASRRERRRWRRRTRWPTVCSTSSR